MTYWQALKSWRDQTLTPEQQIDRNWTISIGNLYIVAACYGVLIVLQVWRAIR